MSDNLFGDLPSAAGPAGAQAPVVLARKWRPRQFAAVVGQDHVVKALQHALTSKRLHHAYLFTGARGVGKTTLARIFAKALNCETGVVAEPCGQCSSCQEIDAGRFVDYIEIDAASNRGVGEIQQLLEQARFAPTGGRFKVYVIDEVHMLSGHAFNAMLKTLEEPPADVKFVLATTDPQKIPVTVLSRCLQFNLKNLRREPLVAHLAYVLNQESVASEPRALEALARAAQGSVRDGLSLTDQAIAYGGGSVSFEAVSSMLGLVGREALVELADAIAKGDAAAAMALGEQLLGNGALASAVLDDLARLYHEVIVQSVIGRQPEDGATDESVRRLCESISPEQAQLYYQICTLGRRDLGLAPDESTGFEMVLLRLLAFKPELVWSKGPARAAALRAPSPQRSLAGLTSPAPPKATPSGVAATGVTPSARPNHPVSSSASSVSAVPLSSLSAETWPALMKKLPLSGLSRQFAQQSSFEGLDPVKSNCLLVRVPIEALNEPSLIARVTDALTAQLGQAVSLRVTVGQPEGPTAAAKDAAKAQALQKRAEESIANSPLVQAIIKEFDATIVPGSIRWIGPEPEDLEEPKT
ncbi:MAG: DNA polymerase III subunit gamma/tau [Burkholderiaceae bacterium]